ncbi:MAG TPA: hypothetical protein VGO53_15360 [Steroidobacteraceae bacterium]|nr:hypothetical protein [Steroidobacteraceae bacterium]
MSLVRPASPGKTRTCPHCKAVILESASVCPGCQHHLRFGSDAGSKVAARTALQIEGKIRHPEGEEAWEYSVVVFVRNERGEEVARHVINVGAMAHSEERVVSLQVDVMPPRPAVAVNPKPAASAGQSPLASARAPLIPPPPGTAKAPPPPAPPGQPLQPAKTTLSPPKPGDPYTSPFGRGVKR